MYCPPRYLCRLTLAALFALPLAVAASPRVRTREIRRELPPGGGPALTLENLAGRMVVRGTGGGAVEVVVTVHAEADSDAEAEALIGSLDLVMEPEGGGTAVRARYPSSHRTFRYPDPDRKRHGFFRSLDLGSTTTTTTYMGRRLTVVSGSHSGAATLWADFQVAVPAGVSVSVRNAVGRVEAAGIGGELSVESGSADVSAERIGGSFRVKTGSGDASLRGSDGNAEAHTGSGDVSFADVKGTASVKTGSGDAKLEDVGGGVTVHTGSGDVELGRIRGAVDVSTGSGDVTGHDIAATKLRADTGSGAVRLAGDLSGLKEAKITTASGDVSLTMAGVPAMSLAVETSSGGIDLDLPDARVLKRRDHRLLAEIGAAAVPVSIRTSSGDVKLRGR